MKIIIVAEIEEDLTEKEQEKIFETLMEVGCSNIELEVKEK